MKRADLTDLANLAEFLHAERYSADRDIVLSVVQELRAARKVVAAAEDVLMRNQELQGEVDSLRAELKAEKEKCDYMFHLAKQQGDLKDEARRQLDEARGEADKRHAALCEEQNCHTVTREKLAATETHLGCGCECRPAPQPASVTPTREELIALIREVPPRLTKVVGAQQISGGPPIYGARIEADTSWFFAWRMKADALLVEIGGGEEK